MRSCCMRMPLKLISHLSFWTCERNAVLLHVQVPAANPKLVCAGAGENGEAGSSGDPVNKAAAEKLIRLSEREQAEGRTGGQAGQRIVYDDAAIERLLDRCLPCPSPALAHHHCRTLFSEQMLPLYIMYRCGYPLSICSHYV